MEILESILLAVSLCADCFAVSLCSSVSQREIRARDIIKVSLAFAVIQSGLLLAGFLFGNLFVGLISRISHVIGFLLLLYVGGSMLLEGIRDSQESRDLNGWRNIILGGIATSIDALAVGVSQSMAGTPVGKFTALFISVFAVTAISVVTGIWGGKTIGKKTGRWAEIVGGIVLIGIGVSILL